MSLINNPWITKSNGTRLKKGEWEITEGMTCNNTIRVRRKTEYAGTVLFRDNYMKTEWMEETKYAARYIQLLLLNGLIQEDNYFDSPHLINNFCKSPYDQIDWTILTITTAGIKEIKHQSLLDIIESAESMKKESNTANGIIDPAYYINKKEQPPQKDTKCAIISKKKSLKWEYFPLIIGEEVLTPNEVDRYKNMRNYSYIQEIEEHIDRNDSSFREALTTETTPMAVQRKSVKALQQPVTSAEELVTPTTLRHQHNDQEVLSYAYEDFNQFISQQNESNGDYVIGSTDNGNKWYWGKYHNFNSTVQLDHKDDKLISNVYLELNTNTTRFFLPNDANKNKTQLKPNHNNERTKHIRKYILRKVDEIFTIKGKKKFKKIRGSWKQRDQVIGDCMEKWKWSDVWSSEIKMHSYFQFFIYRIWLSNFNTWNTLTNCYNVCTIKGCHDGGRENFLHIIWNCTISKKIWTHWTNLWTNSGDTCVLEWKADIFSLKTSSQIKFVTNTTTSEFLFLLEFAPAFWDLGCKVIMKKLWDSRNERLYESELKKIYNEATIFSECQQIISTYLESLAAYEKQNQQKTKSNTLYKCAKSIRKPPLVSKPAYIEHYIITYDGGSRNNPGRAGSGTCILKKELLTNKWTVYYYASTFHINQQTNNYAEYQGVIVGLKNIKNKQQADIRIIGDSRLIQKQLSGQFRASNAKIKLLLQETRLLLETVYHYDIYHVFRRFNKAADYLANQAMDSKTTKSIIQQWGLMEVKNCNQMEKKLDFLLWQDCHAIGALRNTRRLELTSNQTPDDVIPTKQKKPPDIN